jgi:hypothetical protein
MELVRKAHQQPRLLTASDLDPLRSLVGNGALDYALVLSSFHFINRIADLLSVRPEVLPESLRRFEALRSLANRVASLLFRKAMDLRNRAYPKSYEEALQEMAPVLERARGRSPGEAFAPLRERPKLIEALRLMLEERLDRSSLDGELLARVHRVVEESLAARAEDVEDFHARPDDPVDAFAFVGTRYASRTTPTMIESLRGAGFDDLGILDLAIAIADANQWARLYRLVGLEGEIGSAAVS